jgi:putative peptidoglycan lipid II flippase
LPDLLRRGLRLSLFIGLPASLGLILLSRDATAAIFAWSDDRFSASDIARCAAVLTAYSIAIWAYGLNQLFNRAFYAMGDTTTPLRAAVALVAANLVLNLSLIWVPGLRESGLAIATAVTAIGQAMVLAFLLRRRGLALFDRHTRLACVRMAGTTCLMGIAVVLSVIIRGIRQRWQTKKRHRDNA